MALPLAMSIRVLVHDTAKSRSLLGQLGVLSSLRFADTATHINPQNVATTWGMTMLIKRPDVAPVWVAPLDDLSPPRINPPVDFDSWWLTPVAKDRQGNTWSRRQLVWFLANQEGAGHVDPSRDEDLRQLEEMNSMNVLVVADEEFMTPGSGPLRPSVRQIAWELQQTLDGQVDALLQPATE